MLEATTQAFAFVWFLLISLGVIMVIATIMSAIMIMLVAIKEFFTRGKN